MPEESAFEDVGLNDENVRPHPQQKKRSFFSKFGSDENEAPASAGAVPQSQQHAGLASRFLPGRKRGQSITHGQGAELGIMPLGERPKTDTPTVVETEVQS